MNKNSILSGRHVSTFIGSSSGPLRNRSKNYLYFNAMRDPKCIWVVEFLMVRRTSPGLVFRTLNGKKCDVLLGVKDKIGEAHHYLHNFGGIQKINYLNKSRNKKIGIISKFTLTLLIIINLFIEKTFSITPIPKGGGEFSLVQRVQSSSGLR